MIEFSYDETVKACYITLRGITHDPEKDKNNTMKTVCEDPMINIDYREDGSLYGIEILLPDE
jgi:hypothetical protein